MSGPASERSLFGHLAARFTTQRENLATESLAYVLRGSPSARDGFARLIELTGATHPGDLDFQTQVLARDDDAIPDLVGFGPDGRPAAIVEAKFWAALTPNQPVTYLQRLERGNVLLFVAPGLRLEVLWPEVTRRALECGSFGPSRSVGNEMMAVTFDDGRVLALVSWRALLRIVRTAAEAANDTAAMADLAQLAGFTNAMDSKAFLPLEPGELTGNGGRRVVDFCRLVDDLTQTLLDEGLADKTGNHSSAGQGWYGQNVRIFGWGCLLHFSAWKWGREAYTPLWLQVKDGSWNQSQTVTDALARLLCTTHAGPSSCKACGR